MNIIQDSNIRRLLKTCSLEEADRVPNFEPEIISYGQNGIVKGWEDLDKISLPPQNYIAMIETAQTYGKY